MYKEIDPVNKIIDRCFLIDDNIEVSVYYSDCSTDYIMYRVRHLNLEHFIGSFYEMLYIPSTEEFIMDFVRLMGIDRPYYNGYSYLGSYAPNRHVYVDRDSQYRTENIEILNYYKKECKEITNEIMPEILLY